MNNHISTNSEQLTKQEYDILYNLYLEPFINQRILSETSGYSVGLVNKSLKRLIAHDYLNEHAQVTDHAISLFKTRKPKNAIILAAGMGMRMVPINLTTPKALLEVKGERLIDRLINQLHEVGVNDIIVVVGFMKDSFEYLIDEYDIKLSYAADYARTNNIHSLNTVADQIDNTYIVPCDIWCKRNPFRLYELYSWYMVTDDLENGSDVRVNRKMELVRIPKHSGGNGMVGICYLTGDKATLVQERIKAYVDNPAYDDRFWEEALYTDDRMIVRARVFRASDIVEINTYKQLRDLDSDSNQLKSEALQTIARIMDCKINNIVDIEVLKKGMTNRSFLFRIEKGRFAGKYIMRIPGEGTDQLINREHEAEVYRTISGHKLCDDPVYIDPENGYKITKYLEGIRTCDPDNENDLKKCMKKLRALHEMKLTVSHDFDIFGQIDFYEKLWEDAPSVFHDYQKTKDRIIGLKPIIDSYEKTCCLTHIDAVPDNFLFYKNSDGIEELQLTDWEYSGMQDPHVDIAMFCIYSLYDKEQIDRVIDIYFEALCDDEVRAKIYCYIAMCGLLWSNWCEYKRKLGVEFGEYSLRQYRYAKEYYKYAMELIEKCSGKET